MDELKQKLFNAGLTHFSVDSNAKGFVGTVMSSRGFFIAEFMHEGDAEVIAEVLNRIIEDA